MDFGIEYPLLTYAVLKLAFILAHDDTAYAAALTSLNLALELAIALLLYAAYGSRACAYWLFGTIAMAHIWCVSGSGAL
ncbi:MAG: hypothetical protein NVSMB29_08620 [Candidatus Dormibacteria bacterium]